MKLAFVTMVWRDHWLLERWVAHNAEIVPKSQLYVINHGDDAEVARIAAGCNVLSVPRDEMPLDLTRRRWDLLGGLTNGLLGFYDRVICTDVDEFIVFAGEGTLTDHLARVDMDGVQAISPVGLNLIPTPDDATSGPILARHPNALVSAKYTKPCIAASRVVYTVGGHGLQRGSFRVDPEILLFHLHYVTPDYAERMAARQEIVAQSKAENARRDNPTDLGSRYWINWSQPDMIRNKDFGGFAKARMLDVSSGFGPAADKLTAAIRSAGKKTVVDPKVLKEDTTRIVVPEHLRGAIDA